MTDIIDELRHALSLMETALTLIDKTDTAFEVSAHLDLAIQRLKDMVSGCPAAPTLGRADGWLYGVPGAAAP